MTAGVQEAGRGGFRLATWWRLAVVTQVAGQEAGGATDGARVVVVPALDVVCPGVCAFGCDPGIGGEVLGGGREDAQSLEMLRES